MKLETLNEFLAFAPRVHTVQLCSTSYSHFVCGVVGQAGERTDWGNVVLMGCLGPHLPFICLSPESSTRNGARKSCALEGRSSQRRGVALVLVLWCQEPGLGEQWVWDLLRALFPRIGARGHAQGEPGGGRLRRPFGAMEGMGSLSAQGHLCPLCPCMGFESSFTYSFAHSSVPIPMHRVLLLFRILFCVLFCSCTLAVGDPRAATRADGGGRQGALQHAPRELQGTPSACPAPPGRALPSGGVPGTLRASPSLPGGASPFAAVCYGWAGPVLPGSPKLAARSLLSIFFKAH